MAATGDGGGYWLALQDGSVLIFGNAPHHGAVMDPGADVVAISATPDDGGYWLLLSDGAVLPFGNAPYFGAPNDGAPGAAVALAPHPQNTGYWMFGPFTIWGYGGSPILTSTQPLVVTAPLVAGAATPAGDGYWIISENAEVLAFGAAPILSP